MSETLWYCRSCGIVRAGGVDVAPWCRHNALDRPAARMVPIPSSHPLFGEPVEEWR